MYVRGCTFECVSVRPLGVCFLPNESTLVTNAYLDFAPFRGIGKPQFSIETVSPNLGAMSTKKRHKNSTR